MNLAQATRIESQHRQTILGDILIHSAQFGEIKRVVLSVVEASQEGNDAARLPGVPVLPDALEEALQR